MKKQSNRKSAIRIALALLAGTSILAAQTQQPAGHVFDPENKQFEAAVEAKLAKLTLEQKIDLIGGVSTWYTHEEPSIGLPALHMSDGPAGLRSGIPAIAYPAPVALAASWDPVLAQRMGTSLGRDARARDVNILLAPGVNIARSPVSGRNFEYMGEDPFLAGRIAVGYIQGVQSQGVAATVKHFLLNNQEYDRHHVSSDADERTMREIYLPAFEAAVKQGHVGLIMDSYNVVNGQHSTQNGWMNNTVAKHDWGFSGVIVSDWVSVYDGVAAANGGLDLEMPFARYLSRDVLLPAVQQGKLPQATLDDKVRRIVRLSERLHATEGNYDGGTSLFSQESDHTALEVARSGIVLLKNEHALLPLDAAKTCSLAIIGPTASPAVMGGGGSAIVDTHKSVSLLEGVSDYLAARAPSRAGCAHTVFYDSGLPSAFDVAHHTAFVGGITQELFPSRTWTGKPVTSQRDHVEEDRVPVPGNASVRWSGKYQATRDGRYLVVMKDGRASDKHHLFVDGAELSTADDTIFAGVHYLPLAKPLKQGQQIEVRLDYLPSGTEAVPGFGIVAEDDLLSPRARAIATKSDAILLTFGFDKNNEREGSDRTYALPFPQDILLRTAVMLNPRSIVTLTGGGNVKMDSWLDRTASLLHLWYPGQEGGAALAQLLFGDVSPSGKLPVSFERRLEDNPTFHSYYPQDKSNPAEPHVRYTEGVFVGYRYYDSPAANTAHVQPLFPFGFGLSYSTFSFGKLRLDRDTIPADGMVGVTFDVTNTGKRAAAEVAQVYVGESSPAIPRPHHELKGFEKVMLAPGETKTVHVQLDRRAFMYWSEAKKTWQLDAASFTVFVGDSSENLPLQAPVRASTSVTGDR